MRWSGATGAGRNASRGDRRLRLALDREGVVYELTMQGLDGTQRLLPTIPDVNTVLLWLAL